MSYGELTLSPVYRGVDVKSNKFLKGHTPHNKGKKWSEYMSKRSMRRAMKGWKNLEKFRPTTRPDNAGRCRKKVVGVWDDGTWMVFPFVGAAGEYVGGTRENVRRCCQCNQSRMELKLPNGKPTKKVNTDHKYMGVRFYYETDNIWINKINK